jgi:hypothetical protein
VSTAGRQGWSVLSILMVKSGLAKVSIRNLYLRTRPEWYNFHNRPTSIKTNVIHFIVSPDIVSTVWGSIYSGQYVVFLFDKCPSLLLDACVQLFGPSRHNPRNPSVKMFKHVRGMFITFFQIFKCQGAYVILRESGGNE